MANNEEELIAAFEQVAEARAREDKLIAAFQKVADAYARIGKRSALFGLHVEANNHLNVERVIRMVLDRHPDRHDEPWMIEQ